jgi:hypothetical protein
MLIPTTYAQHDPGCLDGTIRGEKRCQRPELERKSLVADNFILFIENPRESTD